MAHSHFAFAPGASVGRARISFTSTIFMGLKSAWRTVANRRAMVRLEDLDDRMLNDLGITYDDIRRARAAPVWIDPTVGLNCAVRRNVPTRR